MLNTEGQIGTQIVTILYFQFNNMQILPEILFGPGSELRS